MVHAWLGHYASTGYRRPDRYVVATAGRGWTPRDDSRGVRSGVETAPWRLPYTQAIPPGKNHSFSR